jgi:uncharacterized protein YcbK (DUF882 family)
MIKPDWSDWDPGTTPNFSASEMACKHCGQVHMRQAFMDKLQALRYVVGPLAVNSGYRCPHHPDEAEKKNPGAHAQGRAVDLAPSSGKQRFLMLTKADRFGFVGIGTEAGFIHLDDGHDFKARPTSWDY